MNDPQVLTPRRTEYGKRIRKDYEAGRKREKMQYESLRAENGRHKQHSDNGSERQLYGDVAIIDAIYKSRRESTGFMLLLSDPLNVEIC